MRPSSWTDVLVDGLVLGLALGATALGAVVGVDVSLAWCALQAALTLVVLHTRRSAPRALQRAPIDDVAQVLAVTANVAVFVIALRAVVGHADGAAADAARMWAFASVYLAVRHNESSAARRRARRRGQGQVNTLIVGAGSVGGQVARRLRDNPELGLRPVGFLDAEPLPGAAADGAVPVLGAPADVAAVVAAHRVGHVIVAFSRTSDEELVGLARACRRLGVEFSVVPRLFEEVTERVTVQHLGGLPLLQAEQLDPAGWRFGVKYAADRVLALVALVLLSPVLLVVAVAVKLSSRGDVFFRQRRVGRDRREFMMLKFRTMTGDPERDGEADASWAAAESVDLPAHAARRQVTAVGRRLRALGLDELPQLINVVRGEMSLVGPRPERVSYVERFEGEIRRYDDRHRVKSGITGWAQVNGFRGETSLADRIEYDNFYIENWGLRLDLRILLLTPAAVVLAAITALARDPSPREPERARDIVEPETASLSLARR